MIRKGLHNGLLAAAALAALLAAISYWWGFSGRLFRSETREVQGALRGGYLRYVLLDARLSGAPNEQRAFTEYANRWHQGIPVSPFRRHTFPLHDGTIVDSVVLTANLWLVAAGLAFLAAALRFRRRIALSLKELHPRLPRTPLGWLVWLPRLTLLALLSLAAAGIGAAWVTLLALPGSRVPPSDPSGHLPARFGGDGFVGMTLTQVWGVDLALPDPLGDAKHVPKVLSGSDDDERLHVWVTPRIVGGRWTLFLKRDLPTWNGFYGYRGTGGNSWGFHFSFVPISPGSPLLVAPFPLGWTMVSGGAIAPVPAVLTVLALYPAIAFFRGPWRRAGRRLRGECTRCGYNLTGLTEPRCPECSTACTLPGGVSST
ncbi:MAG: hypothetical protein HY763_15185 [Planctomycetes bacterium]|nr:hypothetical protein [Planctomycetota bacterium]